MALASITECRSGVQKVSWLVDLGRAPEVLGLERRRSLLEVVLGSAAAQPEQVSKIGDEARDRVRDLLTKRGGLEPAHEA